MRRDKPSVKSQNKPIGGWVAPDVYERVGAAARIRGWSISKVVVEAILQFLGKEKKAA
jgi:hypothetical protein